jgi:glycogen debranching enzyme
VSITTQRDLLLQPALHEQFVVLRAPTQIWCAPDGTVGSAAAHGMTHSDVRVLREMSVSVAGAKLEHLATMTQGADSLETRAMVRGLDSDSPDPDLIVIHRRRVDARGSTETLSVEARSAKRGSVPVRVRLVPDATYIDVIKAGGGQTTPVELVLTPTGIAWGGDGVTTVVHAEAFEVSLNDNCVVLECDLELSPHRASHVEWRLEAADASTPVSESSAPSSLVEPDMTGVDARLERWVRTAVQDLDALRMTLHGQPEREFLAAGAPWYCTLFGRDSIWAARMLLPHGLGLAVDTLHVLASLQGTKEDRDTAEEPGKIIHELRRGELLAEDGTVLPPMYYGTVDATPLWVCLLHDSWRAGMSEADVVALLPHLRAALRWLRDYGDADGDGLIEYIDRSGHGLANQGWKDSHDGVQWHDGRLAAGPIALCEVQAYAYDAAVGGAELLEALGGETGPAEAREWREWAGRLKARFHDSFWIAYPPDRGTPYPAIALDATKSPVDSLSSNIAHLLGTGLLSQEQSRWIADRIGSAALDSGYGLRTLSTSAAGYWPISYHAGSVWPHDTAIAVSGLVADGHFEVARSLVEGLLRAADAFEYRIPELYSGEGADATPRPLPYPGACRPQAWSAAASFAILDATRTMDAAQDVMKRP